MCGISNNVLQFIANKSFGIQVNLCDLKFFKVVDGVYGFSIYSFQMYKCNLPSMC